MKSIYSRKIDFIAIVFFICVGFFFVFFYSLVKNNAHIPLKQIHLQEGLQLLCSIFAVHSATAPDHIRFL